MANRRPLCPSPWRRHNTTIPRLQNLFFLFFFCTSPPVHSISPPLACSFSCVSPCPSSFKVAPPSSTATTFSFLLLSSSLQSFSLQCAQIKHLCSHLSVHQSTKFVTCLSNCSCLHAIGGRFRFSFHQDADWWQRQKLWVIFSWWPLHRVRVRVRVRVALTLTLTLWLMTPTSNLRWDLQHHYGNRRCFYWFIYELNALKWKHSGCS